MFHLVSRRAYQTPVSPARTTGAAQAAREFVYCAALNIQRACTNGPLTVTQAEQLSAALANLREASKLAQNPPQDIQEISAWAEELQARAQALRELSQRVPVEMALNTSVMVDRLPQRASV